MTPEDFIGHWSPGGGGYGMSERAGAQPHFMDLCQLLGVDTPNDAGNYAFEFGTRKIDQKRGFADVFKRGCFGWEYKAPGGDLTAALRQLKDYANALDNPPLLIVSDRLAFEIHTQFTGRPTETYRLALKDFGDPAKRELLRRAFTDPASFQPKRTNRDITEAAAKAFADVAERMRKERGEPPERVAHFLTQSLFCFFAEDVGLLPERLFEKLVAKQIMPQKLRDALIELFEKMRSGGLFGAEDIPWFNGGLFQKIDVPMLTKMDVDALKTASTLNWSAIDVAIFGTLFERGLDPNKRSQLGAHYTDPATIMRIVTPVVERPLRAEWAVAREDITKAIRKSKKHGDAASLKAKAALVKFLDRLAAYRVLDPACGSGNFLYLALKTLKDIEHSVHVDAQQLGLERPIDLVVSPANVLGIELNEYAAELARVTVWIGELQWRLQHGYPFKQNPALEPLDHIECRDALLSPLDSAAQVPSPAARGGTHVASGSGAEGEGRDSAELTLRDESTARTPALSRAAGEGARQTSVKFTEAPWPHADAVIGNPPFVGDKKMRAELGDEYTETLRKAYAGRVPGGADLVCFWFEKARDAIKGNRLSVAGLVSTNSIRGGKNRFVLDSIVESSRIFEAWSDEPWVNDGAAVRVSLVAFGAGSGSARLDGSDVGAISADLGATGQLSDTVNLTHAARLGENSGACFMGVTKVGPFDIPAQQARSWLTRPNPNGKSNGSVLRPSWNGLDLTRRQREMWIVDFGADMTRAEASLYEAPYEFADKTIKPFRETNNREAYRHSWWIHGEARPGLRRQISGVPRFIATPEVAKHRVFVWCPQAVLPDKNLQCTPRADDTTFGILHSRFHELWSLRLGTSLEDRPRYTPTTCFETFPFPAGLTPRDTAHQRTEVLADGAVIPAFTNPPPAARERVSDRAGEGDSSVELTRDKQSIARTPALSRAAGEGAEPTSVVRAVRSHAITIARAAKRLNDLRERWLNPPEWTQRVPEVIPLGMDKSPYPDRILPRAYLGAADVAELRKRTLTNLYNQRPAWLADAHAALDAAVAAAYGWTDYSLTTTDNEILARLLALNLDRAAGNKSASK